MPLGSCLAHISHHLPKCPPPQNKSCYYFWESVEEPWESRLLIVFCSASPPTSTAVHGLCTPKVQTLKCPAGLPCVAASVPYHALNRGKGMAPSPILCHVCSPLPPVPCRAPPCDHSLCLELLQVSLHRAGAKSIRQISWCPQLSPILRLRPDADQHIFMQITYANSVGSLPLPTRQPPGSTQPRFQAQRCLVIPGPL